MKVSARNQLTGKVTRIITGAVNNEVDITLEHGEVLTTVITKESCEALDIRNGKEAIAIIKAPWVVLANVDSGLRFSARNQFRGKITKIVNGAVNSTIHLKTEKGLPLTAIITNEGRDEMELHEGNEVIALVKASGVILATRA
ncbi:TOBE domain-containing protein [Citrobacter sp. JGM124]|uniref:TOBE domain-containing protein n=1 Tax=Citrobacter sp. JGM124 TaxID=2799789 RepID=UPI001BA8F647|nr:TOBE domain-containing protein [Citrobacter sp. JGM124]MBS0849209.1 TOBE domain-containing protein [Citrobacter sp. JGM124]